MTNEIKEILDRIKKQLEIDESAGYLIARDFHETTLHYKEVKALLDYITNLQEENEKLKSYIKLTDEEAKEYMYDTNKEIDDYKSRIDKAIEYIDNHNKLEQELGGTIRFNLLKLYTILKGEDK